MNRDSYRQAAQAQREAARRVATALEAGEPVAPGDARLAALVLRLWADTLPDHPPGKKRGQRATFNVAAAALDHALLVRVHGFSAAAADREVQRAHTGDPEADGDAVKKARLRRPEVFAAAAENS
jgi:hypothetical protein